MEVPSKIAVSRGARAKVAPPARKPQPKPPGGKALARLRFFQEQRGIPGATAAVPKARGAKRAKARAAAPASQTAKSIGKAYLKAFAARTTPAPARTRGAPTPVAVGWRPLGPFSIPHGQTYGGGPFSRPSVSGRIGAIAVDPSDPQHLLIGAAGGGVWETRDLGATWAPRTDDQPALATGAITFDPQNPSIVYTGTGEGDFYSNFGVGLLRSTDGGTTWSLQATAPFVGLGFYKIIVDPQDGNRLYAATTGGLFRSTDGGVTWSTRRSVRTWDISIRTPGTGSTPASAGLFAACDDGLFRSTNGGTTWSAVSLPGASGTFFNRMEVSQAPSNAGLVYAFAALGTGGGKLWRRAGFGASFKSVNVPPDLAIGQAWYDWFLAVAPNNPDVVYLGAINVHRGVRQSDGTFAWTNISARSNGPSIHPDQHTIAFAPNDPNVIYVGNDGGIYRSPDAGGSWTPLNRGLCITEFEYLAQHPQHEAWLLGGTQDNGTLRYEGEETWFHVADGDGGDVGINTTSPYTCFHTYFHMGIERSTSGGGWGSWDWRGPNVGEGYGTLFYPPLEVNGSVVAQAGATVFVSSNDGDAFTEVTLPGMQGLASALTIPSTTRVYVGTTEGEIYRVDRTGGVWKNGVRLGQPTAFISDLMVDPANANRLWLTCSRFGSPHILRSDDGGANWTDVSGSLPDIPFNAIELDPANPQIVYAAADVGVFRSTDAGATWMPFNHLLPNAIVADLAFHASSRLLRCGTKNRGVWEIPVDLASVPDVEIYLRDSTVDTGRLSPSPSGVADPFHQGANTYWWQCVDLKVDAPSFQRPTLNDIDFTIFSDDHGLMPTGLIHENAQRGQTARVYVQVHNRGRKAATNIAVKLFFTDASLGLPDLPPAFWTNFPNNTLPANSPWKVVAPHGIVPALGAGEAQIAAFEWNVPSTAATHTCLLAIITADNDTLATTERSIAALVTGERKCGLKNLTIVNPDPAVGPRQRVIKLNLWPGAGVTKIALAADAGLRDVVRGFMVSKKFADLAQAAGLKKIALDSEEQAQLDKLLEEDDWVRAKLDATRAFAPPNAGPWLAALELPKKSPEPLVLLLKAAPTGPGGSILQVTQGSALVLGGFTLREQEI